MNNILTKHGTEKLMTLFSMMSSVWIQLLKILLLICLLPYLILSFYNHPYYDDFGNAANTIKYGAWEVQKFLYNGWTGRYFSSLLLTVANPVSYGWTDGVRYTPILFMMLIFIVIHQFIALLLKKTGERRFSLWLSLIFLLVYLGAMPQIYQGFYWYTGAAVYQAGNVLVVATFLACYKALLVEKPRKYRITWAIIAILMGIAVSATNEVALLQLLSCIGLCFLVNVSRKNAVWRFWLLLGLTTCTASLFSIIAPGNFVRITAMSDPHAKSLLYSIPRAIFCGVELVSRPQIWVSLFFLLVGWLPFSVKIALTGRMHFLKLHPLIGLVCLFLLTCCCYFPFWWIWAAYTPVRTENAIVFFLLVGWLLCIQSTTIWLMHNSMSIPSVPNWMSVHTIPVLGLVLLLRVVGVPAWLELSTNASPFNSYLNLREASVESQKRIGKRVILFEPLLLKKAYGILTEGDGLKSDASQGPNTSMAHYFNVTLIHTNGDDGIIREQCR